MNDSEHRRRREQLLDRLLSGEIDQAAYDRLLGEVERLSVAAERRPLAEDDYPSLSNLATNVHRQCLQAGSELGPYRIESLLGQGAMGAAWKAYNATEERHVVVKIVPPEIQHHDDEVRRVRESFRLVNALQHQHICPVFGLAEDARVGLYLVMMFIDGVTLCQHRRQHGGAKGAMSLNQVVQVLKPVAQALDYAHQNKVVHRDIKPANIMVGRGNDVQVIDFGLASQIQTSLTRVSQRQFDSSGTRQYMAPEQWRGQMRNLDGRADQYALAVVAYELLSGNLPIEAADVGVLYQCVLHEQPLALHDMPSHVNQALLRGMAKQREDRFSTCVELIEAMAVPDSRIHSGDPSVKQRPAVDKAAVEKAAVVGATTYRIGAQDAPLETTIVAQPPDKSIEFISELSDSTASKQKPTAKRHEAARDTSSRPKSTTKPRESSNSVQPKKAVRQSNASPTRLVESRRLAGHNSAVACAAFSPNGRLLATGGADRMVRIWEASSGRLLEAYEETYPEIFALAFSADSRFLGWSCGQLEPSLNTMRVYDISSSQPAQWREVMSGSGHSNAIRGVAFTPDSRSFLTGSLDQKMKLWDVASGGQIRQFKVGGWLNERRVLGVAISPDGKTIAAACNDCTIRLWDIFSGEERGQLDGHQHVVSSVQFSSDGKSLLSAGSEDKTVRLWDVASRREKMQLIGHTGTVWTAAISPDGRYAVSGAGSNRETWFRGTDHREPVDATLRLWDLQNGRQLYCADTFKSSIMSVAFSPDGKQVVSGSGYHLIKPWGQGSEAVDCDVRIWNLR